MNDFRRILETFDVEGFRRVASIMGMSTDSPEITLHYARTLTESLALRLRAYSHAWLKERGLPSGLPDHLLPLAERMYPRTVEAVGVSVRQLGNIVTPLTQAVEKAMSDAVAECYADGEKKVEVIKARMQEARLRAYK